MKYGLCTYLVLATLSASAFASEKRFAPESVDENDIAAVKRSFQSRERDTPLRDLPRRFPDGAYGYGFDITRKRIKYSNDPVIQRELELKAKICNTDAVVVATARAAKPFLNEARSMVYTKYRLEVVRSIASNSELTNGRDIFGILSGGELTVGSEKYRVENHGSPELQPDESYVVFLSKIDRRTFHISQAIPMRGDRIFPLSSEYAGLSAGMAIDEMNSAVQKVRATHCPTLKVSQ